MKVGSKGSSRGGGPNKNKTTPADSQPNREQQKATSKSTESTVPAKVEVTQKPEKPKIQPTAQQFLLAQVTVSCRRDDPDVEDKVKQLVGVSNKSVDACQLALYDADYDIEKATELLLEGVEDQWQVSGKNKKQKPPKAPVVEMVEDDLPGDKRNEASAWDNENRGPRSRGGGPPRFRGRGRGRDGFSDGPERGRGGRGRGRGGGARGGRGGYRGNVPRDVFDSPMGTWGGTPQEKPEEELKVGRERDGFSDGPERGRGGRGRGRGGGACGGRGGYRGNVPRGVTVFYSPMGTWGGTPQEKPEEELKVDNLGDNFSAAKFRQYLVSLTDIIDFEASSAFVPETPAPAGEQGLSNGGEFVVKHFEKMGLKGELLFGIYNHGFEKPSFIQQRAILPCLEGKDLIVHAPGPGKTAAFSISILQKIDTSLKKCQAVILAPTGERAQQIQQVVKSLGHYMKAKCQAFTDGRSVRRLRKHIVVGTPDRVLDMISKRVLNLNYIKLMVFDKVDEMLSHGFKDQIDAIRDRLENIQVISFSVTFGNDVLKVTKRLMKNPMCIEITKEELTLEGIEQFSIEVKKDENKFEALEDLYNKIYIGKAVIFCNTIQKVNYLTERLDDRGHTVSSMHDETDKEECNMVMREFRSGSSRILVTKDGYPFRINMKDVSHVINYDLPNHKENYIHRIGLTEFGPKPAVINFVTEGDARTIEELEKFYRTKWDTSHEIPSHSKLRSW